MGVSIFPAPVVSTTDTWTLIETLTGNGTSANLSSTVSLSGYKKIKLVLNAVEREGVIQLKFNGSNSGYYGGTIVYNSGSAITNQLSYDYINMTSSYDSHRGEVTIFDSNTSLSVKTVKGYSYSNGGVLAETHAGWINTSAISSLVMRAASGSVFNGGTVQIYGVAA